MATMTWKNAEERAIWIDYQLRLRKKSLSSLGRNMRPPVSPRVMSYVVNNQIDQVSKRTYNRVRRAVAKAIGMTITELWGKKALSDSPSPQPSPVRGEGEKK